MSARERSEPAADASLVGSPMAAVGHEKDVDGEQAWPQTGPPRVEPLSGSGRQFSQRAGGNRADAGSGRDGEPGIFQQRSRTLEVEEAKMRAIHEAHLRIAKS